MNPPTTGHLTPTRGLVCPRCLCNTLPVRFAKLPCNGVRKRYRICAACNLHIITREIIVRVIPSAARETPQPKKACR